ncbi:hypothetical protein [Candidatus Lokiarchaeum ossiferum]|uniref:hypothetical protein n=1 Tax=Candidatus Lokiarchaeum ossiferum TaxID=2951803 RepID=UPI00352EE5D8
MSVTTLSFFLGITSVILLLIGYTYSISFLIKYITVKKILVPIVALVAFCCGSFYLGPSISFIRLLLGYDNLASGTYYIISYVWMPIGTLGIVLMGLIVFAPNLKKPALIFYGILGIVFWIFMFGFTENQHTSEPVGPGELIDVSHANVSLVLVGICLLSILVIDGFGFFLLAYRLKKKNMGKRDTRKSFMVGLGWSLFVISGLVDTMVIPSTVWFILINRGIMMFAFNIIYIGFWSKPAKLE